jgi:hypothetical protein
MGADELSDRFDPRQRYEIYGDFDEASFNDDVEEYPDLFDSNGWPLFGTYDRYALVHPITGLSWHLAPREPCLVEADPDYGFWYALATAFDEGQWRLAREVRRGKAEARFRDPGTENALYKMTSRHAVLGNTNYLRARVVPRLNELISNRVASPELAVLWGEFRDVTESMAEVVAREVRNYKSGAIGGADNREGQLKFYLHWRKYYCDMGLSVNRANEKFTKLVSQIVSDELQIPEGFDKLWFHDTRKQLEGTTREEPKTGRGLANSLLRALQDPRTPALLASAPDEEPRIPPLELTAYRRGKKRPGPP